MAKGLIISIIVTVAIIGLFVWGNESKKNTMQMFGNTDVACLSLGHQNLAIHIHPQLIVTVDGIAEPIPANIGIIPDCMSEVHTHDSTGAIHIETVTAGRLPELNLSHFFAVWGQSPEREGYSLEVLVDGEKKNSVEEVSFRDLSKIELKYTSLQ